MSSSPFTPLQLKIMDPFSLLDWLGICYGVINVNSKAIFRTYKKNTTKVSNH